MRNKFLAAFALVGLASAAYSGESRLQMSGGEFIQKDNQVEIFDAALYLAPDSVVSADYASFTDPSSSVNSASGPYVIELLGSVSVDAGGVSLVAGDSDTGARYYPELDSFAAEHVTILNSPSGNGLLGVGPSGIGVTYSCTADDRVRFYIGKIRVTVDSACSSEGLITCSGGHLIKTPGAC